MSYVVTSSTPKTLKSGRMVFPGQEVSDEEAADNQRLVDKGALTRRQDADAEKKAAEKKAAAEAVRKEEQAEAEKAAATAQKKTAPRSSGRSKAPAPSSVPNKEDQG